MVTDNQQRTTIQAAIAAVITATSGTANVFGDALGVIRADNPAEYVTNYVSSGRVHAWFVGRTRTPTDSSETARGRIPIRTHLRRLHTFEIHFFYGYQSSVTEAEFQNLIDDVITAFNPERSLGGFQATPIQLQRATFDQFGEVLCHHAVFNIEVLEWVAGITPS